MLLAKTTIAAERSVTLALTDDSHLTADGLDTSSVLTIVGNLIDNAIDAAAAGPSPARVTVRLVSDESVRIEVSDTGIGVPEEVASEIFNDGFTTKPAEPDRQRGIGLALVHRLVRQSGGTIDFESRKRRSRREPSSRRAAADGPSRLGGRRVIETLIVEDDYHVASIHGAYLRRVEGFDVAGHASTLASGRAEIQRLAPALCCSTSTCPTATASICFARSGGGGAAS